jgi:phosphatidylinositol alpha-mannosyltransferase
VIFSCHGVLVREYLVERRYRVELLRKAIGGAAAVSVLSEAAATPMRNYFNADPVILPGGVRTTDFAITADRTADPVIVCAASVGAPHKRGDVLFEAFAELRSRRPTARLAVVRTPDPFMSKAVAELPDGAHWVEADQTGALAHAYASAWVSVLPSVDEAFGLVLLESLAAGTPVVAVRSGGPPDIVDSDAIGRLAAPDDPGDLARAMDEALELAAQSGTADACRARAAEYDWSVVTEHYLAVYREVTGAG